MCKKQLVVVHALLVKPGKKSIDMNNVKREDT